MRLNLKINNLKAIAIPYCAYSSNSVTNICIPQGVYYGLATLRPEYRSSHCIKVRCIRLDDILSEFDKIRVVKIDVEGAEYHVLKGLERVLDRIDFLIIEVNKDAEKIVNLLKTYGFKLVRLGFTTYVLAVNRQRRG